MTSPTWPTVGTSAIVDFIYFFVVAFGKSFSWRTTKSIAWRTEEYSPLLRSCGIKPICDWPRPKGLLLLSIKHTVYIIAQSEISKTLSIDLLEPEECSKPIFECQNSWLNIPELHSQVLTQSKKIIAPYFAINLVTTELFSERLPILKQFCDKHYILERERSSLFKWAWIFCTNLWSLSTRLHYIFSSVAPQETLLILKNILHI